MPFAFTCARCTHPLIVADAMHATALSGKRVALDCRQCGAALALESRDGSAALVLASARPLEPVAAESILAREIGAEDARARAATPRLAGSWMIVVAAVLLGGGAWVSLAARASAPPAADTAAQGTPEAFAQPFVAPTAIRPVSTASAQPDRGAVEKTAETIMAPIRSGAPLPKGLNSGTVDYLTYLAIARGEHCHGAGHAVGRATVYMTFAPSGRVTEAHLEGEPLASAPVSRCILDCARAVVLPRFDGAPFTVARRIRLH